MAGTRVPDLEGRTALVTGTARGIGAAILAALEAHGATAHGVDKDTVDVTDPGQVAGLVERIGTIDILVNNAGMLNSFKLADMSVETWDSMIKVHLRGMFLCTRFVIPHMLKQKRGKVINMSGTFGVSGGAEFTHMSAAKAGMIGFTRALAREVGHDGITVNCIAPAIIRTDLYNFMPEEVRDAIVGAYPLGRVGEVEDVVATALFLATKDGDYFTGQTLCPAGGDVMV
jgi:3-oxoacyl-[acyl-carrier protein] reductase